MDWIALGAAAFLLGVVWYAVPKGERMNPEPLKKPEPEPMPGVECPQCGSERVSHLSQPRKAWCRWCKDVVELIPADDRAA